jgi:hypothetical protein
MMPDRGLPTGEGMIMTPQSDDTIARLGEIAALRQVTSTLDRMGNFIQGLSEKQDIFTSKLAEMHTDITVMKMQDEKIEALKVEVADHAARLKVIELQHATEAGGRKALTTLKDWTPFLLGLLVALFALIKSGLIHL